MEKRGKDILEKDYVLIKTVKSHLEQKSLRCVSFSMRIGNRLPQKFVVILKKSDIGVTAGYYKRKWFVAGEAGFDKAIVTHFKHTATYKQNFPSVKDSRYEPATGGNFYYGLQTGLSLKKNDIYLKAGKILDQDFSTTPMVPF